jgi:hypothetical protein
VKQCTNEGARKVNGTARSRTGDTNERAIEGEQVANKWRTSANELLVRKGKSDANRVIDKDLMQPNRRSRGTEANRRPSKEFGPGGTA